MGAILEQVVRRHRSVNWGKGARQASGLLHPAGPAALTTVRYCPAIYWRKGCTSVLIANNSSKRKHAAFFLDRQESSCHVLLPWRWGTRESSMPTPGMKRNTSENRTKGSGGFSPWEFWRRLGGRQEGKLSKVARAGVGKGRRSELLGKRFLPNTTENTPSFWSTLY